MFNEIGAIICGTIIVFIVFVWLPEDMEKAIGDMMSGIVLGIIFGVSMMVFGSVLMYFGLKMMITGKKPFS